MNFSEFRLLNWQLKFSALAKYNLSASGLAEPDLKRLGVDTSFEEFAAEPEDQETLLAETIARLYGREADDVVITTGASEAIFLVYSACAKGKVIVPLPEYEPMFTIPQSLGLQTNKEISENNFSDGILVGITNPNNPTGIFTDDESIINLANSLEKHNGTLFSNETYRGFNFDKPFCKEYSNIENLVVCSSMTKFYGLGKLRIGWIISDGRKRNRLLKAKRLVSGHSSEYCMWIARQVLNQRKRFVRRARSIMIRNSRLLKKFIEETDGVEACMPDAAPFCLVKYGKKGKENAKNKMRFKIDSITFSKELLKKTGVLVSPGDYFGSSYSFRLCITADEEIVKEGLKLLSGYISKMQRN